MSSDGGNSQEGQGSGNGPEVRPTTCGTDKETFSQQGSAAVAIHVSPGTPPKLSGADKYVTACFATALLVVLGVLLAVFAFQRRRSQSPYSDLRSFALSEAQKHDLSDISDLPVDGVESYAQATCVQGETVGDVRSALRRQLKGIPEEARDDIIYSAVLEGMSTSNSVQNISAGVAKSARAFLYLAYWSTAYTPSALASATYSSCVMVTGVDIEVGEEVAEWKTTRDQVLVAHRPCECGYLYCEKCPVFETREAKTPIFKRRKLTLRNQADLHRWMVRLAVDRVATLLSSSGQRLELMMNRKPELPSLSSQGWTGPNSNSFHGSDEEVIDGGMKPEIDAPIASHDDL